jgi:hypothetical protein
MLPVQKEIQDDQSRPVPANHSAILSAGKVVDSVHDLRQRLQGLQDIDLDQITKAVERLSELRTHLLTLQRAMWVVSELSACQAKVLQAQNEVTHELNRLKVKILETLSRLSSKEKTDRLVAIRNRQKGPAGTGDKPSVGNSQSPTILDLQIPELESTAQLEADQTVQPTHEIQQRAETFPPAGDVIPPYHDHDVVADIPASDSNPLPDEPTFGSGNEPPDFGFLKNASGSSLDFDFTDEVLESNKSDTLDESHELLSRHVSTASSQNVPSAAADTFDFDKKLLDDLIKNYGEFAVSPDLPSTGELSNRSEKPERPSTSRVTDEPEVTINRSVPANQNHGEFDRKLKKLIKDYGQVDLYSQNSSAKTKFRALGAFVVLGAVLSGIYYFSAPKSSVVPNSAATQSQASTCSEEPVIDSSASIDKKTVAPSKDSVGQVPPQTVEVSEPLAITDQQGIKKKIKKGGSKQ